MIFLLKKNLKRFRARLRSLTFKNTSLPGAGVRILLYHSIEGSPRDHRLAVRLSPKKFEEELEFLRGAGYTACTVSELIEKGLKNENGKHIVLTFDDGYKDNISTAAPLMKKMGMNATFFIPTSYIDGTRQKKWADGTPREYMNWDDIRELSKMGFEIGSHMIHHIDLTALDQTQLRLELEGSRNILYENIKKEIRVLSYPYGRISQKVIALVKEAGYIGGCSSIFGVNYPATSSYILKRTEIDGYDTITDFRLKLSGYYD